MAQELLIARPMQHRRHAHFFGLPRFATSARSGAAAIGVVLLYGLATGGEASAATRSAAGVSTAASVPAASVPAASAPAAYGASRYALVTHIDLLAEALLPQPLFEAMRGVDALARSPGTVILNAAADGGGPASRALRAALPKPLERKVNTWLAASLDATALGKEAARVSQWLGIALADVQLESTLDVGARTHTANAIALRVGDAVVRTSVALFAHLGGGSVVTLGLGPRIDIGKHRLGIRLGTSLWQAIDAMAVARDGAGLAARFQQAAQCDQVAAQVAKQCVRSVCVGHQPALVAVCRAGVQRVVDTMQAQFAKLDYDTFTFVRGTAEPTLQPGSSRQPAQLVGSWELLLNAMMGQRPAPARFTGTAFSGQAPS